MESYITNLLFILASTGSLAAAAQAEGVENLPASIAIKAGVPAGQLQIPYTSANTAGGTEPASRANGVRRAQPYSSWRNDPSLRLRLRRAVDDGRVSIQTRPFLVAAFGHAPLQLVGAIGKRLLRTQLGAIVANRGADA